MSKNLGNRIAEMLSKRGITEPDLTGHHKPVLHIHYYDKSFNRTSANYLDKATFEKYKKYMKGRTWYD